MTTYWISGTVGNSESILDSNLAVATSDPSADFAFEWNSTNAPNRRQALMFLDLVRHYILNGGVGTPGGPGVDIPNGP